MSAQRVYNLKVHIMNRTHIHLLRGVLAVLCNVLGAALEDHSPCFCSICRSLKSQIINMFKLKDEQLQALEVTAFRLVDGSGLLLMSNRSVLLNK